MVAWWSQEWPDHSSFVRRTGERIKARERRDSGSMWDVVTHTQCRKVPETVQNRFVGPKYVRRVKNTQYTQYAIHNLLKIERKLPYGYAVAQYAAYGVCYTDATCVYTPWCVHIPICISLIISYTHRPPPRLHAYAQTRREYAPNRHYFTHPTLRRCVLAETDERQRLCRWRYRWRCR